MEVQLMGIAAQVIVAVVVGFGSAWLASQKALAVQSQRLNQVEREVNQMDRKLTDLSERERQTSDMLIEIRTRLDLLLMYSKGDEKWKQPSES